MSNYSNDSDYDLLDRLFTLHPPVNDNIAFLMGSLRGDFYSLGERIVNEVPDSDLRVRALHALHQASMATISAVACNQDAFK